MVWVPCYDIAGLLVGYKQKVSHMQKTQTVVAPTGSGEFYFPGFVKIDGMRQLGRWGQVSEYDVVVDDQLLDEVSVVSIGSFPNVPADQFPDKIPLGKAVLFDSAMSVYYTASPAPAWNIEKTVVISGPGWGIEAYVQGFVAIDAIQPRGEWDRLDIVVRYRPNDPALHKITVSTNAPDRDLPTNAVDLGVIWQHEMARYARYIDEIIAPAP